MGSPGGDVGREVPFSPITPGAPAADLDLTPWLLYGGEGGFLPLHAVLLGSVSVCSPHTGRAWGLSIKPQPKRPGDCCRAPGVPKALASGKVNDNPMTEGSSRKRGQVCVGGAGRGWDLTQGPHLTRGGAGGATLGGLGPSVEEGPTETPSEAESWSPKAVHILTASTREHDLIWNQGGQLPQEDGPS